ncbi:hypothetical protein LINGRAHAP2_LOCUS2674 [Linum grandiflorum]
MIFQKPNVIASLMASTSFGSTLPTIPSAKAVLQTPELRS